MQLFHLPAVTKVDRRYIDVLGGGIELDAELLRVMELEEIAERQYANAFGDIEKELIEKDIELEQKAKALEEKERYIKELLEKLESKNNRDSAGAFILRL